MMHHFHNSDADAQVELETLERLAGQMVRQRSAASREDDKAAISRQIDALWLRIRQLRHQLHR